MTNKLLFKGVLFTFMALLIFSCDNEPLEGEFPQDQIPSQLDPGQFKAEIDGSDFVSTTGQATVDQNNKLILTAPDDSSGNTIRLTAENIGVGTFNLTYSEGVVNNLGEYIEQGDLQNPFASVQLLGGSGQLQITEYDVSALTISGTFTFVGTRLVLDGQGNPDTEEISITGGVFNKIPFIQITDDNGGGGGGSDPMDTFAAEIDAATFVVDTLIVERIVLSDIPMIRIMAKDAEGAKIRVDVPEQLGVGTHEMVSISNGTQLIGLYNSNTGGENLTSNPGSITITEFNTVRGQLTASFNFTGTDPFNQDPTTVEVSQGEFSVSYEPDPMNPNTPFTAEIDDVFFNPGFNITAEETIVEGNSVVLITATSGTERIEILFPAVLTAGTYGMSKMIADGDEIVGFYTPEVGVSPTYTSDPGELTLTAFDLTTGVLEGTFFFTASDPEGVNPEVFEITLGSFTMLIE